MTRRRLTQHARQERRGGKVPRISPSAKPFLAKEPPRGHKPDDPLVCGELADDQVAQLVEATGMVFGIRKGHRRWVIGSDVAAAITVGGFIVIEDSPPPPPTERLTRLPDGAPGSAPDMPGRIDQWQVGFTPCIRCGVNQAPPGEQVCDTCVAAETGETPLERALRLAGT